MQLSEAHRATLRACGELRSFRSGQQLMQRGLSASPILHLLDGAVKVQRTTPFGELVLDEVGPLGFLGESQFCGSAQPRTSDVQATADGTLLTIKPKTLQMAMASNDGFEVAILWQFWHSLSTKLRNVNRKLETFFEASAEPLPSGTRSSTPKAFDFDVQRRRQTIRRLGLSNMEVNFLASVADPVRMGHDQLLFGQGDPADSLYIVAEGRIMVSKEIPGAGTEALAFVDAGGIVGEMGLIDHQPRSADVQTAATEATLLRVRAETLTKILHPGRASSVRLMRFLCRQQASRLQATYEKIIGWFILAGGTAF